MVNRDRIAGGEHNERVVRIGNREYIHRTYRVGYLILEHDHEDLEFAIREFYEEWDRQERAHAAHIRRMFEPVT